MPREFVLLKAPQIEALPRGETVFFLSVGPLEDHGPHLPVGMDFFEARHLAQSAAERLERELPGWVGVVLPAAPLGIDGNSGFLSLRVRAHVLRDYLVDVCKGLHKQGFRHFVCFTGHLGPKQITAIEEAGRRIEGSAGLLRFFRKMSGGKSATFISASSAAVAPATVKASPFFYYPAEHGGKRDTSIALDVGGKSWVGADAATLPEVKLANPSWQRWVKPVSASKLSYWGNPAAASDQDGVSETKNFLDDIFPKMRAVWSGSAAQNLFKSWYAVIPVHKSFFKAWIFIFLIALLLVAWVMLVIGSIQF